MQQATTELLQNHADAATPGRVPPGQFPRKHKAAVGDCAPRRRLWLSWSPPTSLRRSFRGLCPAVYFTRAWNVITPPAPGCNGSGNTQVST